MLQRAGLQVMLNELSSTVVFERPLEEPFVRKWQLACQGDIAHVVVMPNITLDKLEAFVTDLIASRARHATAGIQVPPPCELGWSRICLHRRAKASKEHDACSLYNFYPSFSITLSGFAKMRHT